ncbi:MAG: O-antigen ligase family protein [bacterium]
MRATSLRDNGVSALQRIGVLPLIGAVLLALLSVVAGPVALTGAIIGTVGLMVIATRPQWGVAIILTTLMVQYGSRRYDREGVAGLASLLPAGSGLFTVNNMLGLFLALLLLYHVYRDGDWRFLHSRQVQLIAYITIVLAFSGFVSGIKPADFAEVGLLSSSAQDPTRLLVSRGLFLVLFVFFCRRPSDLRMIVGVFLFLALMTAWSGIQAAMLGSGRPEIADYRAGGTEVLIQSSQNPNRLAMVSTIALVLLWEYSQAYALRRWRRWVAMGAAVLFVLTVFLCASRGGLLGMCVAGAMLFVRRRGGSQRMLYGLSALLVGGVLVMEFVPPEAIERLSNIPGLHQDDGGSSEGGGSTQRREYTYELGFQLAAKAPVIGFGPGNWPLVRFLNDPVRSAAAPHSSYLQALVEGGTVTLGLYLLLFYLTVRDLLRCEASAAVMAQARRDGLDWLLVGTRVCLISFLVFSLFADLWDLIFAYFLFGVGGVLIQRYQSLLSEPQPVHA